MFKKTTPPLTMKFASVLSVSIISLLICMNLYVSIITMDHDELVYCVESKMVIDGHETPVIVTYRDYLRVTPSHPYSLKILNVHTENGQTSFAITCQQNEEGLLSYCSINFLEESGKRKYASEEEIQLFKQLVYSTRS